jgi:hypothetical protein
LPGVLEPFVGDGEGGGCATEGCRSILKRRNRDAKYTNRRRRSGFATAISTTGKLIMIGSTVIAIMKAGSVNDDGEESKSNE